MSQFYRIINICTVGRSTQKVNVLGDLILPIWGTSEKALLKQRPLRCTGQILSAQQGSLWLLGSKSKEPKSSSSKGSQSQTKSSGKSAQGKEPVIETTDIEIPQDQRGDLGNTKDQSSVEDDSKHDCFNLLKGTCKSQVELEFYFEECYKVVTNKLDWTNPEGHEYQFDLSKTLPLIKDQGRQVVLANYFCKQPRISKSRKFKHDVFSNKRIIAVTHVKVVKKYDYGYLDEIIVRREDQQLYKFVERDFLRLNLCDIEDMLLLLV
uniref:Protein FORGETTER 1 n=1 Tax=Tanacetum cinerariifolium TaxID=118510 RepID=A0A699H130_TANCI|nr:protein FORGETTER 1 [Tanacetum cinerariifolium]